MEPTKEYEYFVTDVYFSRMSNSSPDMSLACAYAKLESQANHARNGKVLFVVKRRPGFESKDTVPVMYFDGRQYNEEEL